jgi:hypothetical protein
VSGLSRIAEEAAARTVSWDAALWAEIVDGPGRALAESLLDDAHAKETVEAWLRLAAEGIGCGYLVPARAGVTTVCTRLWTDVLPRTLASIPADRRADVLASCWNLGENLEASPAWLRRVFVHAIAELDPADLPASVARIGARIWDPPAPLVPTSGNGGERGDTTARRGWRVQLVDLGREDRRFLPGDLQLVSPRVACVRDRLRPDVAAQAIWLVDPPIVLGPMPVPDAAGTFTLWDWTPIRAADPRLSRVHRYAVNEGFALATLETSQHLVVVRPEVG